MAGGLVQDNKASKMFLIVAVVLGVLATILAFAFISSSAGADRGPKVRVVVALHDLRPNAPIDPEKDLKIEEIPVAFSSLASQTLDPDALANYKGQRLNRRVLARQPVFLSDLADVGQLELREPYRALTLPADAGLVIPGDYVKVVVAHADMAAAAGARAPAYDTAIVGPDGGYRVLAVGSSLIKTRAQVTAADQYDNSASGSKSVTLEVTEDQAKQLLGAVGPGAQKVTLLLCPTPAAASAPAR
jgi:Flp pilus assembly protein CpaB